MESFPFFVRDGDVWSFWNDGRSAADVVADGVEEGFEGETGRIERA